MFLAPHVRKFIEEHGDVIPNPDEALRLLEAGVENGVITAGLVTEVLGDDHCSALSGLMCTDAYQAVAGFSL